MRDARKRKTCISLIKFIAMFFLTRKERERDRKVVVIYNDNKSCACTSLVAKNNIENMYYENITPCNILVITIIYGNR